MALLFRLDDVCLVHDLQGVSASSRSDELDTSEAAHSEGGDALKVFQFDVDLFEGITETFRIRSCQFEVYDVLVTSDRTT